MDFNMKQEPMLTINWNSLVNFTINEIKIYANVDKPSGTIYYDFIINDKTKILLSEDDDDKLNLVNITPSMDNNKRKLFKAKENDLIENIGKIINIYDILHEIEEIIKADKSV